MEGDEYERILGLALRALLDCEDVDMIDLVYRILADANNESGAD